LELVCEEFKFFEKTGATVLDLRKIFDKLDTRQDNYYLDPKKFVFICFDRHEFFNEQNFDFLFMELDPKESGLVKI
jgi:hypothetical protein